VHKTLVPPEVYPLYHITKTGNSMARRIDSPQLSGSEDLTSGSLPFVSPPATPEIQISPLDEANPEVQSEALVSEIRPTVAPSGDTEAIRNELKVSPTDDSFMITEKVMSTPVSLEDEETDPYEGLSQFSDTDSDEDDEQRGRATGFFQLEIDDTPPTLNSRRARLQQHAKVKADRKREQLGLEAGQVRKPTRERSPLAINSITRTGDTIEIKSGDKTVTIDDAKVAEEMDESFGHSTLSPIERYLKASQETQDIVGDAFAKIDGHNESEDSWNLAPSRPERPVTPLGQYGMEEHNPAFPPAAAAHGAAAAESGRLGRSPSRGHNRTLSESRLDFVSAAVRKYAIDPGFNVASINTNLLWNYLVTQYYNNVAMTELLKRHGLTVNIKELTDVHKHDSLVRSELLDFQAEYEERFDKEQQIHEGEVADLQKALANLEEVVRQRNTSLSILQAREEMTKSYLSPEAKKAIDSVEEHAAGTRKHLTAAAETMMDTRGDGADMLSDITSLKSENDRLNSENESMKRAVKSLDDQNKDLVKMNIGAEKELLEARKKENFADRQRNCMAARNERMSAKNKTLQETITRANTKIAKMAFDLVYNKSDAKAQPEIEVTQQLQESLRKFEAAKQENELLRTLRADAEKKAASFAASYNEATEHNMWALLNAAALNNPWPPQTRDYMASIFIGVVNSNPKPRNTIIDNADEIIRGRSDHRLEHELKRATSELPVPEGLTREEVMMWFAQNLGVSQILDEIRRLGHNLDAKMEDEILYNLLDARWCVGNYDVLAAFVFSGQPMPREEFLRRFETLSKLLDKFSKNYAKLEAGTKKAKENNVKLRQENIELKEDLARAEEAMDTFEKHNGSPEGALKDLIDLQGTFADCVKQIGYYEIELGDAREKLTAHGLSIDEYDDPKEICNIPKHRELAKRNANLEAENVELKATLDKLVSTTTADYILNSAAQQGDRDFPARDIWQQILGLKQEVDRLKEENNTLIKRDEDERVQAPSSPACPHCHTMKKQVERLKAQIQKLTQANRDAAEDAEREKDLAVTKAHNMSSHYWEDRKEKMQQEIEELQAQLSSATRNDPPRPYCPFCDDLKTRIMQRDDAIHMLEKNVRSKETFLERLYSDLKKSKNVISGLQSEINSLRASSKTSSPTAPSSIDDDGPLKSLPKDVRRIKELEAENARIKASANPPSPWNLIGTSTPEQNGNQKSDLTKLYDLQDKCDELTDEVEALSAQIEELTKSNAYLTGQGAPKCCGSTLALLEQEIKAHNETKAQLTSTEEALARAVSFRSDSDSDDDSENKSPRNQGEDEDPCKDIRMARDNALATIQQLKRDHQRIIREMQEKMKDLTKQLSNAERVKSLFGNVVELPEDDDPCKDVKNNLISARTKLLALIDAFPKSKSSAAEKADNPCKDIEKQLADVNKQISAFEAVTKLREQLSDANEKIAQGQDEWSKDMMRLKNQLDKLENDSDMNVRRRLVEALEANRRQGEMIDRKDAVASQTAKEMRALERRLEILARPDQVRQELLDTIATQKKTILNLERNEDHLIKTKSKENNFLATQLSVLYGERDRWRTSRGNADEDPLPTAPTGSGMWGASISASPAPAPAPVIPATTTEPEADKSSKKEADPKSGKPSKKQAEPPLPKITYDCWPKPPADRQAMFDTAFNKVQEMYEGTTYVNKARQSHFPEPEMTGLWPSVAHLRWRLQIQPTWFARIRGVVMRVFFSPWFMLCFWVLMMVVDQIGRRYEYGVPILNTLFNRDYVSVGYVFPTWVLVPVLLITFCISIVEIVFPRVDDTVIENSSSSEIKTKSGVKNSDKKSSDKGSKQEISKRKSEVNDASNQTSGNKTGAKQKTNSGTTKQWQQVSDARLREIAEIHDPKPEYAFLFGKSVRTTGVPKPGDSEVSPSKTADPTPKISVSAPDHSNTPATEAASPESSSSTSTRATASDSIFSRSAWQPTPPTIGGVHGLTTPAPKSKLLVSTADNRSPFGPDGSNMALGGVPPQRSSSNLGGTLVSPRHGLSPTRQGRDRLAPPDFDEGSSKLDSDKLSGVKHEPASVELQDEKGQVKSSVQSVTDSPKDVDETPDAKDPKSTATHHFVGLEELYNSDTHVSTYIIVLIEAIFALVCLFLAFFSPDSIHRTVSASVKGLEDRTFMSPTLIQNLLWIGALSISTAFWYVAWQAAVQIYPDDRDDQGENDDGDDQDGDDQDGGAGAVETKGTQEAVEENDKTTYTSSSAQTDRASKTNSVRTSPSARDTSNQAGTLNHSSIASIGLEPIGIDSLKQLAEKTQEIKQEFNEYKKQLHDTQMELVTLNSRDFDEHGNFPEGSDAQNSMYMRSMFKAEQLMRQKVEDQLRECHQANKNLRTKLYDERDAAKLEAAQDASIT
jgi:chromosome segregation ATPase